MLVIELFNLKSLLVKKEKKHFSLTRREYNIQLRFLKNDRCLLMETEQSFTDSVTIPETYENVTSHGKVTFSVN